MSTILFKNIENKYNVCRGKDYVKKFCKSLRELVMNIINFKRIKRKTVSY